MSTSLLYQASGFVAIVMFAPTMWKARVLFTIEQETVPPPLLACGSHHVTAHGGEARLFRLVPIGRKATHLLFRVPRVECHDCHLVRQVAVPFADPRRRYTHAFERYALELSQRMTIQDVARHLGVGWDTIKDMQKRDLQPHFAKPKLKNLRQIAIDEIAVGKGHRYLTVVLDLQSGAVVFVGEGKGSEALEPFWRRLPHLPRSASRPSPPT